MKTFAISTLGCKVNQYESRQIRRLLEQLGLSAAADPRRADLAVVNTCCVTHTASAKSRRHIRQAVNTGPDTAVVACGCLPVVQTGELSGLAGDIHVVAHRHDLAAALSRLVRASTTAPDSQDARPGQHDPIRPDKCVKVKPKNDLDQIERLPNITSYHGQTRAFLKIQDGCDAHCTYCIIPKARPDVRSKPQREVLAEAKALVDSGHKEIVLTGVFLGAYGQATVRRSHWPDAKNRNLAHLLDKLAQVPGLHRIRLSSIEPADATTALVDVFAAHPNIMPHLHLSLQSGSDNVLKRMARQYRSDDFRAKIDLLRSCLDRPAITTDIIVGFPGETDEDFEQTVTLAEQVGFAKMHVFAFSPRKGTPAAKMPGHIDPKVTRQRSQVFRDLDTELQRRFRSQFLGETAQVLIESLNSRPSGRAERYFQVHLLKNTNGVAKNDLLTVKLTKNLKSALLATPLP